MDRHIATLYEIVTKGLNTNSYKFALWRALASLAPTTNEESPRISKQDLAPLFLRYYWPLEVKYHIRQGIDPDKDPIVMKLIRQLLEVAKIDQGETLRDFEKRLPETHRTLVNQIAREAFDDVIPRFHIVRNAEIDPKIFSYTGKAGKAGNVITLTHDGREFLIHYKKLIDYVAVSGWVRFTEGFTSAPRLHDKIDGFDLKRGSVSQWREALMVIQNGTCFYDPTHDISLPEVDHVLPWSFVLEDRTWNLVLACRECNNQKRDKLTNMSAIDRLCARNVEIAKHPEWMGHKFARHFVEWHSRDLSSHIKGLYDQAVADKFPKWN
jgi:HNH endonuclease